MLLERASRLAAKITEYQKLKATADEAEQFQSRANQLTTVSDKLSRTRISLKNMREAGVTVDFVPADGMTLADRAKALRAAISNNPSAVNDPPFNIKHEFLDRVAAINSAAERTITASWKSYVRRRADFGSSDVLDALNAIPQFRPSVSKIRQCRNAVEALGNSLPVDPKATISSLNTLVAEHEKSWSDLSAEDISSDVVKFIRDAASDGASLTSFSEEVKKWLDARNLTAAFRIRLK
ncbi:hypothetical protein [Rhizobium leguminosarum]|uniref:hypothetical protein n=1 Tax=Rhizobium leguminosarum TaxID=384 RepID=UPI001CDC3933|nr:hypothetical protein [Rhizobium leguminosarum]MCA2411256.1 hypothetical protein [Rhizobium leguminosarum]